MQHPFLKVLITPLFEVDNGKELFRDYALSIVLRINASMHSLNNLCTNISFISKQCS